VLILGSFLGIACDDDDTTNGNGEEPVATEPVDDTGEDTGEDTGGEDTGDEDTGEDTGDDDTAE